MQKGKHKITDKLATHNLTVFLNFYPKLFDLGENRLRYFQLLLNGSYTPLTLPVGVEDNSDVSPRSLAEALLVTLPSLTMNTKRNVA